MKKEMKKEMEKEAEVSVLKRKIEASRFVNGQIGILAAGKDFDAAIDRMLEAVGTYMEAGRAYLYENRQGRLENTHLWQREGTARGLVPAQDVPKEELARFLGVLERGACIVPEDAAQLMDPMPGLSRVLKERETDSLLCVPVMQGDALMGFLGISGALEERAGLMAEPLSLLGCFVGAAMRERRERDELEQTRRSYREALTNGCEFSYSFDVTEGLIRESFTSAHGVNIVEKLKLSLPVRYDELNAKYVALHNIRFVSEEMAHNFSCEGLLSQFEKGVTNILTEYYDPEQKLYLQVSALMSKEKQDGHVHAFVIGTDITRMREKEVEQRRILQATRDELDKSNQEMRLLVESMGMMRDTYYRIGCIDLDRNSMQTLLGPESEREDEAGFLKDYGKAVQKMAADYVLPEYREKFLSILSPDRIKKMMTDDVRYVDVTYRRLEDGEPQWVRTELMAMPGYGRKARRVMWYVRNVNYEKDMEKSLSQQLFKMNTDISLQLETVLGGVSGGFMISRNDALWSFEYVSAAVAAIQGYTAEEYERAAGGSTFGNVYPDDREEAKRLMERQLAENGTYQVKYRVRHKDGALMWIQDSGKKVIREDKSECVYSLKQDVTRQEEQNIALHNALMLQGRMVDSLSNGILAYTLPEHRVLIMNQEAKRLFDCVDEEHASVTAVMNNKIVPEDMGVFKEVKNALKNPGDMTKYTYRVRTKEGGILIEQAQSQLLQFEDGQRLVLSSMVDMTEWFHMEALLEEERRQYREVLLEGSVMSFAFDLTNGVVHESDVPGAFSPKFQDMGLALPIAYDELIGIWFEQKGLVPADENQHLKVDREGLLSKYRQGTIRVEGTFRAPGTDQYYRVLVLLSEMSGDKHIHAIFIVYDKTEETREQLREEREQKKKEKEAKHALQEAYNAAKRADAAKTNFLANMSHDIRTPMNAIIGLTAIAGTHLDDRERVADCLGKITVSSRHLLGLINEVLDMSKIESGKVDLQVEDFNLPDLIDNLLTMSKPQIEEKHHALSINIYGIEHEKVVGDVQRIQQSFMNLMGNAIKYTPEGGKIKLTVTEEPTNQQKVGCYKFVFEDNGIGMSEEFLTHLFEPFERAKDSRVEKIQGTGLGMAITKNIVQMMNGSIEVESRLNEGTRFTVTIFLELQDAEEKFLFDEFVDLPVLIADDDEISCESACQVLKELGMKGQWVLTGSEAVEAVVSRHEKKEDFFAVILDWKMPGMDGVATAKEIRRRVDDAIPIIIVSAYDWSDIEVEARMAGANAFISKPLFKSKMAYLFKELLGKEPAEEKGTFLSALSSVNFEGKRALLVEDNEINAEIAVEILNMAGLEVECCKDGKKAVDTMEKAKEGYYDIIFMDIQMPVMNGYDAARAIRALPGNYVKRVPIIAMTANAFADDVTSALNAGMNEHIAKPLDLNRLMEVMKRWLS